MRRRFSPNPFFAALNAWGRHEAIKFHLAAVVERRIFVLKHMYDYLRSEKVDLAPNFATLGTHGDWLGFE